LSLPPVSPQQIQAARQGATPAWNALVRDWGPVVLGWCRYQGAPDPEDAAHEVFIRLYQRLDRLDEPQRFRAFLYGISKRVISEHRRRAWWRRWSGAPAPRLDPGPDPEHQLRLAQAVRDVEGVLARVPERFREVLIHSDVEGRSPAEIAELLDLSPNTVRSRLARGRARFRQEARRRGLSLEAVFEEGAHVRA
jgi:RNA polymerase sigma-70 factor (ECF subfamily)